MIDAEMMNALVFFRAAFLKLHPFCEQRFEQFANWT
jgi:hypothetical protein